MALGARAPLGAACHVEPREEPLENRDKQAVCDVPGQLICDVQGELGVNWRC